MEDGTRLVRQEVRTKEESARMLTVARKVLADCKAAHELLETESDAARFRLIWVAGVALLRTVGHVLEKVDSRRDPKTAVAARAAWKRWKADKEANAIFWEFIEEERNNILKEYEFGFLSGPIGVLVTPGHDLFALDGNLFCPLAEGRFAGEDCRDVLAEGIEWWEEELRQIESRGDV
jgi:hypothetical protein